MKSVPIWIVAVALWLAQPAFADPSAVTTYHYDNLRTGWNANETVLTPANVRRGSFGRLGVVTLDEQVDAQPLYVPGVTIGGTAHNVVYVATEGNTVYAIDAESGAVLNSRKLGQPVSKAATPLAPSPAPAMTTCRNSGDRIGIAGTPVIDTASRTLYAVAYMLERKKPVYRLYALALDTLADRVSPALVAATQTLNDNTTSFSFDASSTRQRAGLALANGNVYAAFTSFCDYSADKARGWVLGWQANTLTPLTGGRLLNSRATAPKNYFLTTVWMSGSGIAADDSGNLFFVTGNSASDGTTYSPPDNLPQSVVKLSGELTTVRDYFTPFTMPTLEKQDQDFGSGGVMLLPAQSGAMPNLATAAGKAGTLYLMNRDSMGHYVSGGPDAVPFSTQIGRCWCGQSYYQGADGVGRVISSGGSVAAVWKIATDGGQPSLVKESGSSALPTGQDSGFFTTVSSNGTQANSQIVWAVTRPVRNSKPPLVYLYAIDPSSLSGGQSATLFSAMAGTWPHTFANTNTVPLVANGRVYVASYKKLVMFGLGASPAKTASLAGLADDVEPVEADAGTGHVLYGTVVGIDTVSVKLRTRAKKLVTVDTRAAEAAHLAARPVVGGALMVRGDYDARGVLKAESTMRAKPSPDLWEADR